jgi:hypothetical protein
MTAALLPAPELQFIDGNGDPISGGTVETYIPGTSTPKTTWLDQAQTAVNTNPIVLNSDGRCIIFADGDYRVVLRDAAGNEIYDQLSSTVVSAAMYPVVSAPTIADAVHLLGLDGMIADEAAARAAADSAEQAARIAADNALGARIDAEITRATAAEAHLQTEIDGLSGGGAAEVVYGGFANAGSGHVRITFPTPFAILQACVACIAGSSYTSVTLECQPDLTGADIYVSQTGNLPAVANVYWIACGTN